MKWSIIKKRSLYSGFFKLMGIQLQRELFSAGQSKVLARELIDRGGQVIAVLPYDPVRDEIVLNH